MMSKRYIVYYAQENTGYYDTYLSDKEFNSIEDIVAILKNEDKAKEMVKANERLGYVEVIWED